MKKFCDEQCPFSDSETVLSQKLVKCIVCTHSPASTPRCAQACPVGCVAALSARPCALCWALCCAPCRTPAPCAPCAPARLRLLAPACAPALSLCPCQDTISLGNSPIQFYTNFFFIHFFPFISSYWKIQNIYIYIYIFSFNSGPFCPKFPQNLMI